MPAERQRIRTVDGLGPRSYPDRDLKILFGWAAARCSYPDCHAECIAPGTPADRAVVTGIIAHIEAHSDRGPRANPSLTKDQRDCYDNWILLCPTHHTVVDGQPNTYTTENLRGWKAAHEKWVREMYRRSMPGVTNEALSTVAMAILNTAHAPTSSFTITPPVKKMNKNRLTHASSFMLTMGIGKARDVEGFVSSMARLDYSYPERLRAGFVNEYNALYDRGYRGDDLFAGMQAFATGTSNDFNVKAAGLAVLGYMFEKCEVFEP